ncbi:hypothetical protein ACEPAG_6815 [Sanghuangporus baumii]
MASSVPTQVMYPPPPSFGSGHSHNPHPPPPHPPQPSHYGAAHPQASSSSSYHPQSVHHPHHATSLPPPPPPPVRQQHYQGYSAQYASHSSQHHEHQYPQERLPSIRDLDFQFHQQQQSTQAQAQLQQQQGQSQQQQSQQQQHPTQQQTQLQQSAGSAAAGPSASGTGSGGGGGGSTVSPASLVITPSRQRRAWATPSGPGPSSSATGTSQPQLYAHHHLPPPAQPQSLSHSHSHSQLTPISSGSASASASSSSFTAGPSGSLPTGQTTQYHASSPLARRHRSESLISGGGRGSVGSIGSTSSLGGMSGGPVTGSAGGVGQSAGQAGGMSMPSASPVTRSPLVSSAYGHNTGTSTGYAHPLPPAAMGATPLASTSTMSGTGTIGPPSNAASSSAAGGNPHSPYGTAFPSPHTPHHHLHTPLSQSHVPPGASGTGAGSTAGGAQAYARQEYGEYDYSAGYGTPAATGPPGSAAPLAQGEPHAYSGRGMPQTQPLYGAPPQSHPSHHAPPPTTEPWSASHQQSPLVEYQQQSGHHIPQQQHQHAAYGRSSGSSSLVGAVSGGYGSAPPLSSHASTHQQAHGHGQLISPGAGEHEVGHGPGPIGGGLTLGVAGGSAGGPLPESAKAHFLPKVRELCYMLHEFAVRYANSASQPSQAEVEDMARRAAEVIHLLSEYKRAALAEGAGGGSALHHPHPYAHSHTSSQYYPGVGMGLPSPAPEEHEADRERGAMRAPKRPWEDVAQESDEDAFVPASISAPVPKFGGGSARELISKQESISTGPMVAGAPMMGGMGGRGVETDKDRTAAEKDMALIRSKRATNVGSLGPGAPKGKYRKRSRATPPGKCHSCNIRETPEWRRGPDGARTLCNACGLHYAKLIRKRDKQAAASTDGSQARIEIDMETLRASTRAASEREQLKAERERERREREKAGFTEKSEDGGEQGGIGMEFELGLGLETGSNGISSGNEAGDNTAGMERKGNGNAVGMIAPVPAPTATSSNGSNSSLDNWRTYIDADIGQTSSFLRGTGTPGIAPAPVRPTSS